MSRKRDAKRQRRKEWATAQWEAVRLADAIAQAHADALADDAAWHKARRPFPRHRPRRMAGK